MRQYPFKTIEPGSFWLLIMACLILIALVASLAVAYARPDARWADAPLSVQRWFQGLMQPDNPYMSCCGEADGFESDIFEAEGDHYIAIITDGRGLMPDGTRIEVPNNKIKFDAGNPSGHGWIFIGSQGQVYCYVTPGGV